MYLYNTNSKLLFNMLFLCSYPGIQNNTSNFKVGILIEVIDKIIELKKKFHELKKAINENKTNRCMWSSIASSNSELMEVILHILQNHFVLKKSR